MLSLTRLIAAGALLVSLSAQAADQNGHFSVRGVGLLECAAFNQERERKSTAYQMIGGWLDGYVTGANASLPHTYDILSYQSTELIAEVIHRHCLDNPQHRLFEVVTAITAKKLPERVQASTPLNKIVVGDLETFLYAATVNRLQQKLVAQGYLAEDAVTDQFSPTTAKALAAFQQAHAFQGTGFPDQATLWKLFES